MTERPLPDNSQENEQMTELDSEFSPLLKMDEETGFVTLTEEGFEPWVALIHKGNARTVFERLYANPGEAVDISDIPNPTQVLRYLRNKFGEDSTDATLLESLRINKQQYAVLNARTQYAPPDETETEEQGPERSPEDFDAALLTSLQTIVSNPNTSFTAFIEQLGISPKTGEPLQWHEARSEALRIFTRTRYRVKNKKASDIEQDLWSLTKSASGYRRDHEVFQNFVPELLNWFYRQYEKEQVGSHDIPEPLITAAPGESIDENQQPGAVMQNQEIYTLSGSAKQHRETNSQEAQEQQLARLTELVKDVMEGVTQRTPQQEFSIGEVSEFFSMPLRSAIDRARNYMRPSSQRRGYPLYSLRDAVIFKIRSTSEFRSMPKNVQKQIVPLVDQILFSLDDESKNS